MAPLFPPEAPDLLPPAPPLLPLELADAPPDEASSPPEPPSAVLAALLDEVLPPADFEDFVVVLLVAPPLPGTALVDGPAPPALAFEPF